MIVEPVAANMGVVPPAEGFLPFLREITEKNGALLIFDEVITGFRLSLGGAQEYYNIRPDLSTFGKIIGGGMPLAAYGGRRDVMSCIAPLGPVYQAGTLSGNPVAVTAGLETLRQLIAHPDIYEEIGRKAGKLEEAFREKGLTVNRAGSFFPVFLQKNLLPTTVRRFVPIRKPLPRILPICWNGAFMWRLPSLRPCLSPQPIPMR